MISIKTRVRTDRDNAVITLRNLAASLAWVFIYLILNDRQIEKSKAMQPLRRS